jgi:hypothetical protein
MGHQGRPPLFLLLGLAPLCFCLSGCVLLLPFVEPDAKTKAEIRSNQTAANSPAMRRGEYRSRAYKLPGATEKKLDKLMRQMKSPVAMDRIYAAFDLGELGPKAAPAVPILVNSLHDSSKHVRRASVKALAKIGPPACGALPEMRKSINDKDKFVRESAQNAERKLARKCTTSKKT